MPDGTTRAYHTLDTLIHVNKTNVVGAIDVKGAFPSISRGAAHEVAQEKAHPSPERWSTGTEKQGDKYGEAQTEHMIY